MKRIYCIFGMLCCLLTFSQPALAADHTLTDGDGNSLVLQQSSQQGFFHYSSEDSPFTFDIPALFTKAVTIDGNSFELTDATNTCLFSASSFRTAAPLTIEQFFKTTRDDLGVKPAYERLDKKNFILSWIKNGNIHYQKVFLNVDAACVMELTYPTERKKEFDPLVTHSANSLKFAW